MLASMLQRFRTAHEPAAERMLTSAMLGSSPGRCKDLQRLDEELNLEAIVAGYNSYFIPEILTVHPEAKFIHLVRDPMDWLRSCVNFHASRPASGIWAQWLRFVLGDGIPEYGSERQVFELHGLAPLEGYLLEWLTVHKRVVDRVPTERCLRLTTDSLSTPTARVALAEFLGVPTEQVRSMGARYRTTPSLNILEQLDQEELQARVASVCGDLAASLLPTEPASVG